EGVVMAEINLEAIAGKLNRVGYDAFIQALRHAKGAGNRNLELAHLLLHVMQMEGTDTALTLDHFKLDRGKLMADLGRAVESFRKNETEMPNVARPVWNLFERGWINATLLFGETQIRTGHLLVAALQEPDLHRALTGLSKELSKINVD